MADKTGFIQFIRDAGISALVLPDNSAYIDAALAFSLEVVYAPIKSVSALMYDKAVYNLGVHTLFETAPDQTSQTFFVDNRQKLNLNSFVPGIVQSSSDEGTSSSMLLSDFLSKLTMADLQYIKTPWGRAYMAIAQRVGTVWGVS